MPRKISRQARQVRKEGPGLIESHSSPPLENRFLPSLRWDSALSALYLARYLQAIDLALRLPVAPFGVDRGGNGGNVLLQPIGKTHNNPNSERRAFSIH